MHHGHACVITWVFGDAFPPWQTRHHGATAQTLYRLTRGSLLIVTWPHPCATPDRSLPLVLFLFAPILFFAPPPHFPIPMSMPQLASIPSLPLILHPSIHALTPLFLLSLPLILLSLHSTPLAPSQHTPPLTSAKLYHHPHLLLAPSQVGSCTLPQSYITSNNINKLFATGLQSCQSRSCRLAVMHVIWYMVR